MLNFNNYLINESLSSGLDKLDSEINYILRNEYNFDFESQLFWDECFIPKCTEFLKQIGFVNPSECGRHRCVFISNNREVVIKIPNCSMGIMANEDEYQNQNHPENKHAKCKLIHMKQSGIPILIMEKVNISVKDKPDWAWCYDCGQVGTDKKGRFKAYDYNVY